jgi:hypothetical protein
MGLIVQSTPPVGLALIPILYTVLLTIIWSALERASDGRRPDLL